MLNLIVQLINIGLLAIVSVIAVRYYREFKTLEKKYGAVASQLGNLLAGKRWTKYKSEKLTKEKLETRKKIFDQIKAKVPAGLLDGLDENNFVALLHDDELLTGIVTAGRIGGELLQGLLGLLGRAKDGIETRRGGGDLRNRRLSES